MDEDGSLIVVGREEDLRTQAEIERYVRSEAKKAMAVGWQGARAVIGCHRRLEFGRAFALAQLCRQIGFPAIELRTILDRGPLPPPQPAEFQVFDWRRPETAAEIVVTARGLRDGVNDGTFSGVAVFHGDDIAGHTDLAQLTADLKERRTRADLRDCVQLEADSLLRCGIVLDVVKACRDAGFPRVVFAGLADQPPASRSAAPVPDSAARTRALQEVRSRYRLDQASPAERPALARRLFAVARACDDTAPRWALLEQTAELAGNRLPALLIRAAELLADDPHYRDWEQLANLLAQAPPDRERFACCWKLAGTAWLRDDSPAAGRFLDLAESAAQQVNDPAMLEQVRERRRELELPAGSIKPSSSPAKTAVSPATTTPAPSDDAGIARILLLVLVLGSVSLFVLAGLALWLVRRREAGRTHSFEQDPPASMA